MSNPGDRPVSPLPAPDFASWRANLLWQMRDCGQTFWGEARTRILLWYVLILIFAFGISVPIFRQLLFANIDARVRQDMAEELEEFHDLLTGKADFNHNYELGDDEAGELRIRPASVNTSRTPQTDRSLVLSHGNPNSKAPKTEQELKKFFDAYMAHRIPEDEVYFIAFTGGKFYKSSPRARPAELNKDGALMRRWAQQTEAEQNERESGDPNVGSILYLVEPVRFGDRSLGTFVMAHSTAGERAEGLEATLIAAQVAVGVLGLALVLIWLAVGRVLYPLQSLATTVKSISESDLSRRLAVQGQGELANLATQFNDMMNRVEMAFISQRNFINDAGHELRTPITIIRGHLEVMDVDSIDQQETVALVTDELDRMSRFVDDLIVLAKAERPDFLQIETVDIATLTQELFAKAQALASRHWVLEEIAQGQIAIDRQRITQAIMNLAHNATQHTRSSDTITFGSAIGKGKLHVWVRDTGEGIPLPDQKRIFERFARAANSRRRSEGAGLGLSIVRAIAVAHGGEVSLRSQLGEGSTFAIVLPLQLPG